VPLDFCPRCASPRTGAFRYCRKCAFDFEDATLTERIPVPAPPAPAEQSPPPRPTLIPGPRLAMPEPAQTPAGVVDPVAKPTRNKMRWVAGGAVALVLAIAAISGGGSGNPPGPGTTAATPSPVESARVAATPTSGPAETDASQVPLAVDPADVAHIVAAIDELATTDGDGIIAWVNREGQWVADNQDMAMVANETTSAYIQHMLAALQKVVDGGGNFTDDVNAILGLRDEIAAIAPDAVQTAAPTSQPAAFKDIELTGRGSKVAKFKIPETAAGIVRITHRGSSNFIVETIDGDGATNDLLVNEIGNYGGVHLFDVTSHSVAFKIDADGRWRALVRPITRARAWDPTTKLSGERADVVRLTSASSGLVTLDVRHRGSSNFVVMAYTADDRSLLVNEIGNYSGEVLLPDGTLLLTVEADGTWSGTPG
jgi:hypothetical protein